MNFKNFLSLKRKSLGISQNKFSKLIGITQSYYNGIERGEIKNPPSDEIIEKMAKELLLSSEETERFKYLAALERTPNIILEKLNKLQENKGNSSFVETNTLIPLFSRISAGVGAITDDEPEDYILLPQIKNYKNIFAVNVYGDSMEPTIKDHSVILCNATKELHDGEVGAFVVNGESYVKRIKKNKDFIVLLSDNPNYNPIYVAPYDDFKIVGKVTKVINDI